MYIRKNHTLNISATKEGPEEYLKPLRLELKKYGRLWQCQRQRAGGVWLFHSILAACYLRNASTGHTKHNTTTVTMETTWVSTMLRE